MDTALITIDRSVRFPCSRWTKNFRVQLMSLIQNSLSFLAENLEQYPTDPDSIIRRICDRSFALQSYASQAHDALEDNAFPSDDVVTNAPPTTAESGMSNSPEIQEFCHASSPMTRLPIPEIPGVDSDVFKNLLMSWFYAGYYTAKAESSKPN